MVTSETRNGLAVIRIDDGKANAVSHDVIRRLHAALDTAEKESGAVLLLGRPGRFSAGFDLNEMRKGGDAVRALVTAGAELALRLYGFPKPVVIACTGHALAMGAILLFTADLRFGARGDFRIGMNEVAIGLTLPDFATQLAAERISKRHLSRAAIQAEVYSPETAVDAGYLDAVTEPDSLFDEALGATERLAKLDRRAFGETKLRLRTATIERIRDRLADDMRQISRPPA